MEDILTKVQDKFRNNIDIRTDDFLGESLRLLVKSDSPSLDFIVKYGLDKEGVVVRKVRTSILINGRDGSINEFWIVGNHLTIVHVFGSENEDDVLEIYSDDELVCSAEFGNVFTDLSELKIDDVVVVWELKRKRFYSSGLWEKDLKKLFLCQEEEVRSWQEYTNQFLKKTKILVGSKKLSEVRIEEK